MVEKPDSTVKITVQGDEILRRWQGMSGELAIWKPQWQDIADKGMPRMAGISTTTDTPSTAKESALFDTTANDAAMTMAGGLMSHTSPANEAWFSYQPIRELRSSEEVKRWLAGCTEVIRELLADSNFYTEMHEDLLTHCLFGTSALYIGMHEGKLYFESLPLGSFAIAEDGFGRVNTLFREMDITASQAADLFGKDKLPKEIQDCLDDDRKAQQKHKFIHAVYPRPEKDRPDGVARNADWGKPFASCYVEVKSKQIVKESGYDSFPFAVGRYLKWSALASKSPYGYGPGFAALPDVRMVNHLQMVLDCAAEKIVRPSMIAPEELEGDLILSAGGITYMPTSVAEGRWPKPIQQVGDYNVAVDRVKMRQEAINLKFHVELFRMFAQLDRQMTAREVAERAAEKITLISPAFSRLQSEKHGPILQRVFSLALQNKLIEDPPEEAIIPVSEFMGITPDPSIAYSSRLALALDQLGMAGFAHQIEQDLALAQFYPQVFDTYNVDVMTRDRARMNNVPTGWMRSPEEVAQIQQARAQQQQAAQMAMMIEQGSKAVKNLGGVDETKKAVEEMT
jgi:hypothetical protein